MVWNQVNMKTSTMMIFAPSVSAICTIMALQYVFYSSHNKLAFTVIANIIAAILIIQVLSAFLYFVGFRSIISRERSSWQNNNCRILFYIATISLILSVPLIGLIIGVVAIYMFESSRKKDGVQA